MMRYVPASHRRGAWERLCRAVVCQLCQCIEGRGGQGGRGGSPRGGGGRDEMGPDTLEMGNVLTSPNVDP